MPRADYPKHFNGKRFFNPDAPQVRGFRDFLRWQRNGNREASPGFVSDVLPSKPPSRVEGGELRVTLVNHSTVLLQQRGTNILTDPVWSERASPFLWIGPSRSRAPGVRWDDLPPIDIVLLSHNHYDHLDLAALRRLAALRHAGFIVPLGVARLLRANSVGPLKELDWGESLPLGEMTIHAVPALHFSGRSLFDRNKTLWCGYVVETADRIIYFAGDTAFGPHFAAIRERFGAPCLALLPIGAYEPRWFMGPVHMPPEDAVRAHRILEAQTSIAIHHGTFRLADEALDAPPRVLAASDPGDSFLVLRNGEWVTL